MYWDPFDEIRKMHKDFESIFSKYMPNEISDKSKKALTKKEKSRPALSNIYETEKNVVAKFEIPGVNKEDIELNVEDNEIEVKAKRKIEVKKEKKGFYRYEARESQFYRRLPLPKTVNPNEVSATYNNGILNVVMPKKKLEKGNKRIQIK